MKKSAAVTWENRAVDRIQNHIPDLPYTDLDREIWQNELEHFVPQKIFDSHTHLWSNHFITPETRCTNDWLDHETDGEMLQHISRLLYPGRNCDVLGFAQPVMGVDYAPLNSWVASEVHSVSPDSRAVVDGKFFDVENDCFCAHIKPAFRFR